MDFLKYLFLPITAPLEFIQKYFKAIVLIVVIILLTSSETKPKANLSIINLDGMILDASSILEKIDKVKKNNAIKGVLFVVNSPGGAVAPSIEIKEAIKELSKVKPVVAYAKGTMASGSYYASIWANKIVANPGSLIGSIGIIFESVNVSSLLKKLGIEPQIEKIGIYKEVGTPLRKWNKLEKEEIQKVLKDTYNMFVSDVSIARKLDIKNQDKFAQAHIFTAKLAKEVGLIDIVGTINIAKQELIKLSNVKNPIWEDSNKKDVYQKLLNHIYMILLDSSKTILKI